MSRSRPGHLKPCCAWCEDNRKDLRHAITVGHVRKEFCSENCLHEFKRVYLKSGRSVASARFDEGAVRRCGRWPVPCVRL